MSNVNEEQKMVEEKKAMESIQKSAEHKDGAVTLDPQGNYFDPDKNFNDGDTPTVVMVGGKAKAVVNGQMYDVKVVDGKSQLVMPEEMSKEELDYAKDNKEDLQEDQGTLSDSEKENKDNSVIQGLKAQVNSLPEEKLIDTEE